jgi:hypothetical protein
VTDVVLIAVIVAFFLGAAWLVTALGRVTAGYRDDAGPEDEDGGQPVQLTESEQPR